MQHVRGQRQHQHAVVPHCLVEQLILRGGHQQPQQLRRRHDAQRRHRAGEHQRQKRALLDGVGRRRSVPRANLTRDEHRSARGHHGECREHHRHHGVCHADGGQRAAADGADDARKHQPDEDRQRVFQHHRQRKAQRRVFVKAAQPSGIVHHAFLLVRKKTVRVPPAIIPYSAGLCAFFAQKTPLPRETRSAGARLRRYSRILSGSMLRKLRPRRSVMRLPRFFSPGFIAGAISL